MERKAIFHVALGGCTPDPYRQIQFHDLAAEESARIMLSGSYGTKARQAERSLLVNWKRRRDFAKRRPGNRRRHQTAGLLPQSLAYSGTQCGKSVCKRRLESGPMMLKNSGVPFWMRPSSQKQCLESKTNTGSDVLDLGMTRLGREVSIRSTWIILAEQDSPRFTSCCVL